MTIKSILKTACIFLQKDELLSVQSLDGTETETDEQTKELSHLLRCLNLVLSEIATDYIPLLTKIQGLFQLCIYAQAYFLVFLQWSGLQNRSESVLRYVP